MHFLKKSLKIQTQIKRLRERETCFFFFFLSPNQFLEIKRVFD